MTPTKPYPLQLTCIQLIIEKQNELSVDDFSNWLHNNQDQLTEEFKYQIMAAYSCGLEDSETERYAPKASLHYYNEFYG